MGARRRLSATRAPEPQAPGPQQYAGTCAGCGPRTRAIKLVAAPWKFRLIDGSAARRPMRGHPASSRPLQARGLRRIAMLVPVGCAEGLLHLARELRARQRAGTGSVTLGWRRLSPSAELLVEPDSGARCAVRDIGSPGSGRYLWTVQVFGDRQLTEGRSGELVEARSQAEAALACYLAASRQLSKDGGGNA